MTAAWLVDLDGTLYHAAPVKLAMAIEIVFGGPRVVRVLQRFRALHEVLRSELTEPVACPWSLQLERTASECGLSPIETEALVRRWMIERPGRWIRLFRRRRLLAEIRVFRASGGRTAVVSDYPGASKLRALDADDLFDAVVACGEPESPGRLKPWPDGYLRAAQLLDVAPADCLVIGDREDADGEAARRAGMSYRPVAAKRARLR